MNARIQKKILSNKRHPKFASLAMQVQIDLKAYALGECHRLGVDPSRWGSVTLTWPPALSRRLSLLSRSNWSTRT